jgi:hypothetical protein
MSVGKRAKRGPVKKLPLLKVALINFHGQNVDRNLGAAATKDPLRVPYWTRVFLMYIHMGRHHRHFHGT